MDNPRILRRYTDLTSVIDVLVRKSITLLDPDTWDDKNDTHYMSAYKSQKKLKSLKAICFTTAAETYHHWKIFSPGNSGICISFITEKIQKKLNLINNVKSGLVEYRTLKELREGS